MEDDGSRSVHPRIFSFDELASATNNFNPELRLDESCFAITYKGKLQLNSQIVAIKQFKPTKHSHKHFLTETLMLSHMRHENVVTLIGYCADGSHRLVVYEYTPLHSLRKYLFRSSLYQSEFIGSSSDARICSSSKPLDWNSRIKIAVGVAKGLDYLHHKMSPAVIHGDLQSSCIMLGEGLSSKISNFELARLAPIGNKIHVTTKTVEGTCSYIAPEYANQGLLSVKLDVYNFGILLLELITGKNVFKFVGMSEELDLASLVQLVETDKKRLVKLVDPQLKGEFKVQDLNKIFEVAAMCLKEESEQRASVADVVAVLSLISMPTDKYSASGSSKVI